MKNNLIKNWLKKTGIFSIKTPADGLVANLKKQFRHEERSFFYGGRRYLVDSLYCHASPGVIETITRELSPDNQEKKLLNLGGGTGQVSTIFEFLGYDVSNVDIASTKVDKKNSIWDLNHFPYPFLEQSFDIIVGQEIIEHLENPWEFFRQARRILKPDGLFIISTPNILSTRSRLKFWLTGYFPWFTPDCFEYHINPLPYWQIELIAKQTGFKIQRIMGNGDYFFHQDLKPNWKKILNKNEEIIISLKISTEK